MFLFHGHSDNIAKHTDAKEQPRRSSVILCPLVVIIGVSLNSDTSVPKQARPRRVAFWVTLFRGVLAALLGLALILQPDKTRPILANFMGMFWLVSGITSLRWGATGERARRRSVVAGIIGIVGGLFVLTRDIARGVLDETVVIYILGVTIVLTGLIHAFGGFRIGEDAVRQWSWTSFLLGIFEIILGILLIISPGDPRQGIFIAASIWAFIGAIMLFGDALRQRAQHRRHEGLE